MTGLKLILNDITVHVRSRDENYKSLIKQKYSLQILIQNVNQDILNKLLGSYLQKRRHQVRLKKNIYIYQLQTLYQDLQKSEHSCEEDRSTTTDPTDTIMKYTNWSTISLASAKTKIPSWTFTPVHTPNLKWDAK